MDYLPQNQKMNGRWLTEGHSPTSQSRIHLAIKVKKRKIAGIVGRQTMSQEIVDMVKWLFVTPAMAKVTKPNTASIKDVAKMKVPVPQQQNLESGGQSLNLKIRS